MSKRDTWWAILRHDRAQLLSLVGATVVIERHDRTLLVGVIKESPDSSAVVVPLGCLHRVRIFRSRIRSAHTMPLITAAQHADICRRQRAGERFTIADLDLHRPQRSVTQRKRA
jgi:hypothetical protein